MSEQREISFFMMAPTTNKTRMLNECWNDRWSSRTESIITLC